MVRNTKDDCGTSQICERERELLERIGSNKYIYRRSRSFDGTRREAERAHRNKGFLSRSCGNSPARELTEALNSHLEKRMVLDVMDGLDTMNPHSTPFC